MESSHTDAPPRPKGFLRRNWGALCLLLGILATTAMDARVSHMSAGANYIAVSISEGCFKVTYGRVFYVSDLRRGARYLEWTTPSYGGLPTFTSSPMRTDISIPLWAFVLSIV